MKHDLYLFKGKDEPFKKGYPSFDKTFKGKFFCLNIEQLAQSMLEDTQTGWWAYFEKPGEKVFHPCGLEGKEIYYHTVAPFKYYWIKVFTEDFSTLIIDLEWRSSRHGWEVKSIHSQYLEIIEYLEQGGMKIDYISNDVIYSDESFATPTILGMSE